MAQKLEQVRNFRAAMENILRQPLVLLGRESKVIALVRIDEPQGLYYGGTVAAPAIAALFENILLIYAKTDLLNKCLR